MLEGISCEEWMRGAIVAALGAGLCALVENKGNRCLAFDLWLLGPLALCMATSSFSSMKDATGLLVLFILVPTLPWALISFLSFAAVRLLRSRLRKRRSGRPARSRH